MLNMVSWDPRHSKLCWRTGDLLFHVPTLNWIFPLPNHWLKPTGGDKEYNKDIARCCAFLPFCSPIYPHLGTSQEKFLVLLPFLEKLEIIIHPSPLIANSKMSKNEAWLCFYLLQAQIQDRFVKSFHSTKPHFWKPKDLVFVDT